MRLPGPAVRRQSSRPAVPIRRLLAIAVALAAVAPAARAFTFGENATIRLGSAKPTWCAQIEPAGESFLITAVVPSTISATWDGRSIFVRDDKVSIGGDRDGNGAQDVAACFGKEELRGLFAGLPRGNHLVTLELGGDLTSGGTFHAALTIAVVSGGPGMAASLSPNPLTNEGWLTFTTTRPGRVRVSLFDLHGRLIRRVMDERTIASGYHDVRIDAWSDRGARLPSGVYFYRVEAPEGVATGRFAIAR